MENLTGLIKGTKDDFPAVYSLMEKAFPESERRTRSGQKKLLENPYYHYYLKKQGERVVAFLAVWEFEQIRFIEHFAVDSRLRGAGIGGKMLKEYLESSSLPVFLETEPPETEIARRRIGFYQRAGFVLNDFPYCQPALQKGQKPLPLMIMTYPVPVSREDFEEHRRKAFHNAYSESSILEE